MGPSLSGSGTAEAKVLHFQAVLLFWGDVSPAGALRLGQEVEEEGRQAGGAEVGRDLAAVVGME
jgi:predicted aconitase with swiveling domain